MRVPRTDGCFFQYGVKITNCFFVSIFFTRQKCDFLCVHSTHTVPRIDVLEFLTLQARWGCARGVVGKQVAGARDFWIFFES